MRSVPDEGEGGKRIAGDAQGQSAVVWKGGPVPNEAIAHGGASGPLICSERQGAGRGGGTHDVVESLAVDLSLRTDVALLSPFSCISCISIHTHTPHTLRLSLLPPHTLTDPYPFVSSSHFYQLSTRS